MKNFLCLFLISFLTISCNFQRELRESQVKELILSIYGQENTVYFKKGKAVLSLDDYDDYPTSVEIKKCVLKEGVTGIKETDVLKVKGNSVLINLVDENGDNYQYKIIFDLGYFLVKFDTKGGTEVKPRKVLLKRYSTVDYFEEKLHRLEGVSIIKPEIIPKKKGYVFDYWSADIDCKKPFSFKKDVIRDDVTLYSKWKPAFTVNIHKNNGSSVSYIDIEKNTNVGVIPSPVRSGYVFAGWYDNGYKKKYDLKEYILDSDLDIYALWLIPIEFYPGGNAKNFTVNIREGDVLQKPKNPESNHCGEGCVFNSWFKDKELKNPFVFDLVQNNPLNIYGSWNVKVSFSNVVDEDSFKLIQEGRVMDKLGDPFSNDSVFVGWYSDESYTEPFDFTRKIYNSTNIYAKMLPIMVLVNRYGSITGLVGKYRDVENLKVIIPRRVRTIDVKSILHEAFSYRNNIVELSFMEGGVVSIGRDAFSQCSSLHTIKLPKSLKKIGKRAFYHCDSLKYIYFSEGLKSIGNKAFAGCNFIEKIEIPSTLNSLANGIFLNCKGLKEVSLPDNLLTINKNSFSGCASLEKINMPKNLEFLRSSAFFKCKSLKKIVIYDKVKSIGGYAFSGCSNLELMLEAKNPPKLSSNSFGFASEQIKSIVIKDEIRENYKKLGGKWGEYVKLISKYKEK